MTESIEAIAGAHMPAEFGLESLGSFRIPRTFERESTSQFSPRVRTASTELTPEQLKLKFNFHKSQAEDGGSGLKAILKAVLYWGGPAALAIAIGILLAL